MRMPEPEEDKVTVTGGGLRASESVVSRSQTLESGYARLARAAEITKKSKNSEIQRPPK